MSLERSTKTKIRVKAMDLLARREHSQFELRQKLIARFVDRAELVDLVLMELIQDNLLNDERFTSSYIEYCLKRGFGPTKARYELQRKGIADGIIREHLEGMDNLWLESLQALAQKRFSRIVAGDYKEKAKRSRYFAQRGFTGEQIRTLLFDFSDV